MTIRIDGESFVAGNGYLDYNEYISFLKPYLKDQKEIEQEMRDAFKAFKKGSGVLNMKQLRLALTSIGETLTQEETEELFDMMDKNKDGVIDVDGGYTSFNETSA